MHYSKASLYTDKNRLSNAIDKQDDLEIIENRFMDLKMKFSKVQENTMYHCLIALVKNSTRKKKIHGSMRLN